MFLHKYETSDTFGVRQIPSLNIEKMSTFFQNKCEVGNNGFL